ncbi:MAG: hypothetical protein IKO55_03520 [Kiritimatiellae bacterium]|nr:hypothetical protein [Kiritimatiellia bacterium]
MTVLIAIPTFERVHAACFQAVFDAAMYYGDCDLDIVTGYDCARARNAIAKKAIEGGYSHVLMVDSDIVIPADCIGNLLEPAARIVLGFYRRKDDSGAFEMFSDAPGYRLMHDADLEGASDRIEVKGGGFGCAMVEVEAFKRLRFPWFVYEQREDGSVLSEDLHFSRIAQNAGIRTYADTRVLCGHVGLKTWE